MQGDGEGGKAQESTLGHDEESLPPGLAPQQSLLPPWLVT